MIITKEIEYRGDGILLRGFCAYPDRGAHLPAVLVAPTWGQVKMILPVIKQ